MSLSELIDDKAFPGILSAVVGAFGVVLAAFLGYLGLLLQRGNYSSQIHVIEVATKRNNYWSEYLKASELANGIGSESHEQAKAEVSAALARIRDEADAEIKRLSWGNQITRSLRGQQHTLQKADKSVEWLIAMGLWVMGLVLSIGLWIAFFWVIFSGRLNAVKLIAGFLFVCGVLFPFMAGRFYRSARKERYPEPPRPLFDRM